MTSGPESSGVCNGDYIGWGSTDDTGVATAGATYNPRTDSWREIPDASAVVAPRAGASLTVIDDKMLVWGGISKEPILLMAEFTIAKRESGKSYQTTQTR